MVTTFYQTGPNGLFIFYQVFNLILQSAVFFFSLIESIVLIVCAVELIFMNAGSPLGITNNTVANSIEIQHIVANAISFGVSTYLLFVSSILLTVVAFRSMRQN